MNRGIRIRRRHARYYFAGLFFAMGLFFVGWDLYRFWRGMFTWEAVGWHLVEDVVLWFGIGLFWCIFGPRVMLQFPTLSQLAKKHARPQRTFREKLHWDDDDDSDA